MEYKEIIDEWILDYLNHSISPEERLSLQEWLQAGAENQEYFRQQIRTYQQLQAIGQWESLNLKQERIQKQVMWESGWKSRQKNERRIRQLFPFWKRVAAVALLLVACGAVWYYQSHPSVKKEFPTNELNIASGSPKAILIWGEGQEIHLGTGENRHVGQVAGMDILQDSIGGVRIRHTSGDPATTTEYARIIIPEGGEYYAELSDGTRVWLNSSSELTFPVPFQGELREVNLKGEGYFEVKTDQYRPFIVHTEQADIRVLGTSFNVMAYPEERKMTTTLVSGSVRIDHEEKQCVLIPSQQAVLSYDNHTINVREVDTNLYTSWTKGVLEFDKLPLREVMTRLARWYGITFEFEDNCGDIRFSGGTWKYVSLQDYLNRIEMVMDVTFRHEGNKVMIKRK